MPPLLTLCRCLAAAAVLVFAAGAGAKPFDPSDAIRWRRIMDFATWYESTGGVALFSPSRDHFVLHLRYTNPARNVVCDELLLFSSGSVHAHLEHDKPLPAARLLAHVEASDDLGVMDRVRWINERELSFIAQGSEGTAQGFRVSIDNGVVSQITHERSDVAQLIVYPTTTLYYRRQPAQQGQAIVVTESITRTIFGADRDWVQSKPIQLMAQGPDGKLRELGGAVQTRDAIWISPDGRRAITFGPVMGASPRWEEYRFPFHDRFGFNERRRNLDPTSEEAGRQSVYLLHDIETGKSRKLIDAPTGWLSRNRVPSKVFWSADGKSAIVTNTFLPLDVHGEELDQRRRTPATAEVDLETGAITVIMWEPVGGDSERAQEYFINDVDWNAADGILMVTKRFPDRSIRREARRKLNGRWELVPQPSKSTETFTVFLRQSPSERPLVVVRQLNGPEKLLYDPNPGADSYTWGTPQPFACTDRNGIEWKGGLLFPPGYQKGVRYPLVVQTHGFDSSEFLVDGPRAATTGYAAQPLANRGFVVLQLNDNRRAQTVDAREAKNYAEGYRSAIEQLIRDGIADPARVGLVGWSRTAYHTVRLIADNPKLLAAAIIADGIQPGYFSELTLVNAREDGRTEIRSMNGSPGETTDAAWLAANDPIYRLPAASTAIRIDAISGSSVISMWETYAVLRDAKRPVEMMYYPYGSHSLIKPRERWGSQAGAVDWFCFWLKGEKRTTPNPDFGETEASLSAQYERWEALRNGAHH
jgi:dienelactone hydrolase